MQNKVVSITQVRCKHDFKTGGLLYTEHHNQHSPTLETFDTSQVTRKTDYFCHPREALDVSARAGVFSIAGSFAFYVCCTKCGKKELRHTHEVCFYCLRKLGVEVEQDNLEDYFKEHPRSAKTVSLKICPDCQRVFAWYRWNTDED